MKKAITLSTILVLLLSCVKSKNNKSCYIGIWKGYDTIDSSYIELYVKKHTFFFIGEAFGKLPEINYKTEIKEKIIFFNNLEGEEKLKITGCEENFLTILFKNEEKLILNKLNITNYDSARKTFNIRALKFSKLRVEPDNSERDSVDVSDIDEMKPIPR